MVKFTLLSSPHRRWIQDMNNFDCEKEIKKITSFLKNVFQKTGKQRAVLAWSGGIDSTVSLFLLRKALEPKQITVLHLPYSVSYLTDFQEIQNKLQLMPDTFFEISIKSIVNEICRVNEIKENDHIRKGNSMARTRMILLYDYAKKLDALVCGTENKTEELLGYFTRFGDEASDIEPIRHLYKTQVYQLARQLGVPEIILNRKPTAGLWEGQTDEGEFGFTYEEADNVLYRYFDKKESIKTIEKEWKNAKKIILFCKTNEFKKKVPYFFR